MIKTLNLNVSGSKRDLTSKQRPDSLSVYWRLHQNTQVNKASSVNNRVAKNCLGLDIVTEQLVANGCCRLWVALLYFCSFWFVLVRFELLKVLVQSIDLLSIPVKIHTMVLKIKNKTTLFLVHWLHKLVRCV